MWGRSGDRSAGMCYNCYVNSTYPARRPCRCTFDLGLAAIATFDIVGRAFDAAASAFGIDPFDVRATAASFARMIR